MSNSSTSPIDPVKLDKLGEVAIKVGLQLAEGQDLIITAPMTAAPLVRRITEYAKEDARYWQVPALLQKMADDGSTFADLNK